MKKRIFKDKRRRELSARNELKVRHFKSVVHAQNLPYGIREKAFLEMSMLQKDSFASRIKNRCILSGRAKAVYKMFKMSRLLFRMFSSNGLLPGVRKASW